MLEKDHQPEAGVMALGQMMTRLVAVEGMMCIVDHVCHSNSTLPTLEYEQIVYRRLRTSIRHNRCKRGSMCAQVSVGYSISILYRGKVPVLVKPREDWSMRCGQDRSSVRV